MATKMTAEDKKEALEALRRAVQYLEDSWDAQRDLELIIGKDIDGLGQSIEDYAVMGADAITEEQLDEVLSLLDDKDSEG